MIFKSDIDDSDGLQEVINELSGEAFQLDKNGSWIDSFLKYVEILDLAVSFVRNHTDDEDEKSQIEDYDVIGIAIKKIHETLFRLASSSSENDQLVLASLLVKIDDIIGFDESFDELVLHCNRDEQSAASMIKIEIMIEFGKFARAIEFYKSGMKESEETTEYIKKRIKSTGGMLSGYDESLNLKKAEPSRYPGW